MSPAQQQPKTPFWRRHLLKILAAALLLLGLHDVFGTHGYLAMRRSQKELDQLHGEIERLTRENRELTEHVNALKSDPETIEKIAREEMGFARPGEMIFKVPAPPDSSPKSNPPSATK
jgi:cell division protein FtsB